MLALINTSTMDPSFAMGITHHNHHVYHHSPGYASGSVFHPAVSHPQTDQRQQFGTAESGDQRQLRPGNSISIADLTEVFQLLGSAHLRSLIDDENDDENDEVSIKSHVMKYLKFCVTK